MGKDISQKQKLKIAMMDLLHKSSTQIESELNTNYGINTGEAQTIVNVLGYLKKTHLKAEKLPLEIEILNIMKDAKWLEACKDTDFSKPIDHKKNKIDYSKLNLDDLEKIKDLSLRMENWKFSQNIDALCGGTELHTNNLLKEKING